MPLEIIKYPDKLLSRKSQEIKEITPEIRVLAHDMAEAMYAKRGVGLAAPQVGELCRLIVVDTSPPEERNELKILVNPAIIHREGVVEEEEGCLSVVSFQAKVKRAAKVVVKAQDIDGNALELQGEGLLAICLQHEIDHLDGILFLDHLSRLKRALYDNRLKKKLKAPKAPD